MARNRRVVFGRINRRNPNQETFEERAFADDMAALADSHLVGAEQVRVNPQCRSYFRVSGEAGDL